MSKVKIFFLGFLFLCCENNVEDEYSSLEIYLMNRDDIKSSLNQVSGLFSSNNTIDFEIIKSSMYEAFDIDLTSVNQKLKVSQNDSVLVNEFSFLVNQLVDSKFYEFEDQIYRYVENLEAKNYLSDEQKNILNYYASFYVESIIFIRTNDIYLMQQKGKIKMDAAECLLGMLGDGITYGIGGAGVGCAIGGAAGAVAGGVGAGPGCVTGGAVGGLLGFIGGVFSGAADHCFN